MKYFLEISNADHGGLGIGEYLWSPVGKSWENMNSLKKGDRIIHNIKDPTESIYKLWGISVVAGEAEITDKKPPIPGDYKDYEEYYIIPLRNFVSFEEKVTTQEFLNDNEKFLREKEKKSFFIDSGDIKAGQGDLRPLPQEVFNRMRDYMGDNYEKADKELVKLELKSKKTSMKKFTVRVSVIVLFALLTAFSFYKVIEIIDIAKISTFLSDHNIWPTIYLTLTISTLIWTSFGLFTMLFTDGENIGDFGVKLLVRAIVYPVPFIFPIIFLLYNYDFNNLIETSLMSGLLVFMIKVISDIDPRLMNLINKKNN